LPDDGSIGNIGRIKIGKRPYFPTFHYFPRRANQLIFRLTRRRRRAGQPGHPPDLPERGLTTTTEKRTENLEEELARAKRRKRWVLAGVGVAAALALWAAGAGCHEAPPEEAGPSAAPKSPVEPGAGRPGRPPDGAAPRTPDKAPQDEARQAFRRKARTLANLALAREYPTFSERWGSLAAAAAAAGIGLEPRDDDGRAYQSLRAVKAFVEVRDEADAKLRRTGNREFLRICEGVRGDIECYAKETLGFLGK